MRKNIMKANTNEVHCNTNRKLRRIDPKEVCGFYMHAQTNTSFTLCI